MLNNIQDSFLDLVDLIKYDILGQEFKGTVDFDIPNLRIKLNIQKDGVYGVSEELPGLLFSAKKLEDLPDAIFDSLLVYYDIPRYQAKKLESPISIALDTGEIIVAPQQNKYNLH